MKDILIDIRRVSGHLFFISLVKRRILLFDLIKPKVKSEIDFSIQDMTKRQEPDFKLGYLCYN